MKIVGIGASAGGVEALGQFFQNLPNDTGAAYVVIQHLSPDFKSIMDELLARYTTMPVHIIKENELVQPNRVYLMPSNKSLVLQNSMLILQDRAPNEILHLPIDRFFHSLADDQNENAVAIVLSGSGTDGSRGVKTIKENGGLVMVQSPQTSRFNGMPNAVIKLDIADSILPPDQLAKKLMQVLRLKLKFKQQFQNINENGARTSFERILFYAEKVSGIQFAFYREPTLIRRMEKRMVLKGYTSMEEYADLVSGDEHETQVLYKDFLISVTRFFRDVEACQELENKVIPNLFKNLQEDDLCRVWIPACSTGEEAYTIGILMMKYLEDNNLKADFKIFASDVNKKAIQIAANGVYPYSIAADIPVHLLHRYFRKEREAFVVKSILKEKILFAVQDVLQDPPFIRTNLISCRNFLIYLKPEAQRRVLSTFHFALQTGAYLMLGPSESIGDLRNVYDKINQRWNIFQKQDNAPMLYSNSNHDPPLNLYGKEPLFLKPAKRKRVMPAFFDDENNPFSKYLLEQFTPICVFVNQNLDLIYSNGNIDNLFSIPRALASLNLHKMLNAEEALVFQNGVRKAYESDEAILYKDMVLSKRHQEFEADLRFHRIKLPGVSGALVMIEIQQLRRVEEPQRLTVAEPLDKSALINEQIKKLETELRHKKREMQKLVGELESTNDELQASNRELMTSNEELQSTNEELQSVNEELYTVNTELQNKNEELTTANNDINNLMKSTEIGTIFLDNQLRIRKFTPAIRRQFDLITTDVGRPITAFSSTFDEVDLSQVSRQVFESLTPYERSVKDKKGNHYLLRILPYRTQEDTIRGLVVTFVTINDFVKTRERLAVLADQFWAIFHNSDDLIMIINEKGVIELVNNSLARHSANKIKMTSIFNYLPQKERSNFRSKLSQVFDEKTKQHVRVEFPNGKKEASAYEFSIIPANEKDINDKISYSTVIAKKLN